MPRSRRNTQILRDREKDVDIYPDGRIIKRQAKGIPFSPPVSPALSAAQDYPESIRAPSPIPTLSRGTSPHPSGSVRSASPAPSTLSQSIPYIRKILPVTTQPFRIPTPTSIADLEHISASADQSDDDGNAAEQDYPEEEPTMVDDGASSTANNDSTAENPQAENEPTAEKQENSSEQETEPEADVKEEDTPVNNDEPAEAEDLKPAEDASAAENAPPSSEETVSTENKPEEENEASVEQEKATEEVETPSEDQKPVEDSKPAEDPESAEDKATSEEGVTGEAGDAKDADCTEETKADEKPTDGESLAGETSVSFPSQEASEADVSSIINTTSTASIDTRGDETDSIIPHNPTDENDAESQRAENAAENTTATDVGACSDVHQPEPVPNSDDHAKAEPVSEDDGAGTDSTVNENPSSEVIKDDAPADTTTATDGSAELTTDLTSANENTASSEAGPENTSTTQEDSATADPSTDALNVEKENEETTASGPDATLEPTNNTEAGTEQQTEPVENSDAPETKTEEVKESADDTQTTSDAPKSSTESAKEEPIESDNQLKSSESDGVAAVPDKPTTADRSTPIESAQMQHTSHPSPVPSVVHRSFTPTYTPLSHHGPPIGAGYQSPYFHTPVPASAGYHMGMHQPHGIPFGGHPPYGSFGAPLVSTPPYRRSMSFGTSSINGEIPGMNPGIVEGALDNDSNEVLARLSSAIPDLHYLISRYKETRGHQEDLLRRTEAHQMDMMKKKEDHIDALTKQLENATKQHSLEASKLRLEIGNMEERQKELQDRCVEYEISKKVMQETRAALETQKELLEKEKVDLANMHAVEKERLVTEFDEFKLKAKEDLDREVLLLGSALNDQRLEAEASLERQKARILDDHRLEKQLLHERYTEDHTKEKQALEEAFQEQRSAMETQFNSAREELESKLRSLEQSLDAAVEREKEWAVEREKMIADWQNEREKLYKEKESAEAAFAAMQADLSKKAEDERFTLQKKGEELRKAWAADRDMFDRSFKEMQAMAESRERERGELQKMIDCFGEITDSKTKGDAF